MAAAELQDRYRRLTRSLGESMGELRFISADMIAGAGEQVPNFADPLWRDGILECLKWFDNKFRVVVLDNVSCLFPSLDENAKTEWDDVNQWLLSLRHNGIATILCHHLGKDASKGGRGTSAREDAADTVIKLSHPLGYHLDEGAIFKVEFTKARGIYGNCIAPFTLQIRDNPNDRDKLIWTTEKQSNQNREISTLLDGGMLQKDIADVTGLSPGRISQIKKEAIANGYLDHYNHLTPKGREYCGI